MSAGLPPTFLWGVGDGKSFTARDRLMVIAYQRFSDSVCGGCGHSRIITTDAEYEGYFQAKDDEVVCEGCASVERLAKRREDAKQEPEPGAKTIVDFTLPQPEPES